MAASRGARHVRSPSRHAMCVFFSLHLCDADETETDTQTHRMLIVSVLCSRNKANTPGDTVTRQIDEHIFGDVVYTHGHTHSHAHSIRGQFDRCRYNLICAPFIENIVKCRISWNGVYRVQTLIDKPFNLCWLDCSLYHTRNAHARICVRKCFEYAARKNDCARKSSSALYTMSAVQIGCVCGYTVVSLAAAHSQRPYGQSVPGQRESNGNLFIYKYHGCAPQHCVLVSLCVVFRNVLWRVRMASCCIRICVDCVGFGLENNTNIHIHSYAFTTRCTSLCYAQLSYSTCIVMFTGEE